MKLPLRPVALAGLLCMVGGRDVFAADVSAMIAGSDSTSAVPVRLVSPDTPLPHEPAVVDTTGVPQRDVMDVLHRLLGHTPSAASRSSAPRVGLSVVVLPSFGYDPSRGFYAGGGAAASGWFADPLHTAPSRIALNATRSASGQTQVILRTDLWLARNDWNVRTDWRSVDLDQPTYGLGSIATQPGRYPMQWHLLQFEQTLFRRVRGDVLAGVGLRAYLDRHITDERAASGPTPFSDYSGTGVTHTQSVGVSANVQIEGRDSPIAPTRGILWDASLSLFSRSLGADRDWQELRSDFRAYPRLNDRGVLALWSLLWFTFGDTPYLDLPATGRDMWARTARGYLQGQIRGRDWVYTEAEYRHVLTADGLLGAVAFLNTSVTTAPGTGFGRVDPGAGVGLRIKFIKRTRTNLTIDRAWGRNGSGGWFLGTEERF